MTPEPALGSHTHILIMDVFGVKQMPRKMVGREGTVVACAQLQQSWHVGSLCSTCSRVSRAAAFKQMHRPARCFPGGCIDLRGVACLLKLCPEFSPCSYFSAVLFNTKLEIPLQLRHRWRALWNVPLPSREKCYIIYI